MAPSTCIGHRIFQVLPPPKPELTPEEKALLAAAEARAAAATAQLPQDVLDVLQLHSAFLEEMGETEIRSMPLPMLITDPRLLTSKESLVRLCACFSTQDQRARHCKTYPNSPQLARQGLCLRLDMADMDN